MESQDLRIRCILCSLQDHLSMGFIDIRKKQVPTFNKTVKSVLIHLSRCIKKEYDFDFHTFICNSCFDNLTKYDEIMVQLLAHQKALGSMLEKSMNAFEEHEIDKDSISIHNNDEDEVEIITEEIHDEIDTIKEENSVSSINSDEDETSANDFSLSQEDKKNFTCTICENMFRSNRALQAHIKTHLKFVSCPICGVAKKDEEYLELHMNTHEGKTEKECRYCPKKYSRRSHVIRHMHLHWDKKKFQCEKCGVRFSQANILYNHKMNHEAEEEPIICSICHQTFKSKRTFNHHMITHQEDRPMYPCEICGKVFTQKYTIKAHLKTHSEGNESQENSVKKNKNQKKDGKRVTCIICEKVMGVKESLEVHMSEQHDVITDVEENVLFN